MPKKAMSGVVAEAQENGEKIINHENLLKEKENQDSDLIREIKKNKAVITPTVVKEKEIIEDIFIKLSKVSLKFTKEFFALFEINLNLKKGEIVALVGEEESGKTSILRLLAGLENPTTGEITIGDKKITSKLFYKEIMLGYLPEKPVFLFKKTAAENIVNAKRVREKKSNTDMDIAKGILFNFGLTEISNKKVFELSLMQQHILALVRLSLRKLDVLLIDNIFEDFLPGEAEEFFKVVNKIVSPDTIIVFATTDISIAKTIAQKIYLIENGSIFLQK